MKVPSTRPVSAGIVAMIVSVALITAAIFGVREAVPVVSTGVLYLLAVLLVSSYWGLWLGLATAALSSLAFNFFHIPPTGRFTISDNRNWVALLVFFVAAVVTSTLAGSARAREAEAQRRRAEADLAAEMARLLLRGASVEEALPLVGQRMAQSLGLPWVEVEARWSDSDQRRRALPLLVDGERVGTVAVPRDAPEDTIESIEDRVVPALETLVSAARRRDELETQVIETKALRRSNVMKTTLLRSVSHDLRSPLAAITAAAGGLESPTVEGSEREELVSVIRTESDRLARLVDDLLDLSRLQAGSVEPNRDSYPVEELIEAAMESVPQPDGGFDVRLDPQLPPVEVDAAQVERALANVLENATRYAGSEAVSIRAHAAGPFAMVRISDLGPGIPREELERIFEPFHRNTGRPGAGSGLGLSIARGFIEVSGGHIRAESLPGQGTSFAIQLPVAGRRPAGTPTGDAAA